MPATCRSARQSLLIDPHLKTPYIYQYNLSLQQQLANNLTLEAGYIGYSAHGLTGLTDINPFVRAATPRARFAVVLRGRLQLHEYV